MSSHVSTPGRIVPPPREPLRSRWQPRLPERLAPYVFIAPFFALFAAFGMYPLLYALRLSFTNWHGVGHPHWIGLANYRFLLSNHQFWASLENSGVMWLMIVPLQVIGAIAMAAVLSSRQLRFRGFFRTAFIIPFVTPLIAMAQIWVLIFDRDFGLMNHVLHLFGIGPVGWLVTTTWAKPTLALLVLWKTSGFAIILMLAALQGISDEVYEAASLDGAGPFAQFWRITIPLLRRAIAFYVVIATLGVFQMFAEPFVVTHGGPYNSTETAGLYLYNNITNSDLGTGAANSFLLVLLVFVFSLAAVRLLGGRRER
ncbi:MAG: carbohydrate ABC transporter permease [Gaiellaceae bacterium]